MGPALGLPQTPWSSAPLWLFQAWEALGLVEVEVLDRHHSLQPQEVLYASHLPRRVGHQTLAADKQEVGQGEVLQPVLKVPCVEADAHRAPGGVDQARGGVLQGQALEAGKAWVLGQGLGVVGYGAGHRVPDHHDELGVTVHVADAGRRLLGHKVAGCLLHGDLAIQGPGHQAPGRDETE